MVADPLDCYARLERVCLRMLDAARDGDWRRVSSIESDTHALIERLRSQRADAPMDPAVRREKFRILRSIVEIDAQIRHLSQPWERRIDGLLASDTPCGSGTRDFF